MSKGVVAAAASSLRTSPWVAKPCDLCGEGERLRLLGERRFAVRQRQTEFEWRHRDVVCERCGLTFSAEVPEEQFLAEYYAEGHTLRSTEVAIEPGFDLDARLETVRRHLARGRVLEVGAGDGAFCAALRAAGYEAEGVDPLEDVDEGLVRPALTGDEGVSGGQAYDLIVSYHVLEHVRFPGAWLQGLRSALQPAGLVVIEVPDAEEWPLDAWHHEHLTQFTARHLRGLMESVGFRTLSCGEERGSRPHGVVYVGQRAAGGPEGAAGWPAGGDGEGAAGLVAAAEQRYRGVANALEAQAARAREVVAGICDALAGSGSDLELIFWGANDVATTVVRALPPDLEVPVGIVDNADSKVGRPHPGFPGPVGRPEFSAQDLARRIFVLCTRNWNRQIAEQISGMGLAGPVVLPVDEWPHR